MIFKYFERICARPLCILYLAFRRFVLRISELGTQILDLKASIAPFKYGAVLCLGLGHGTGSAHAGFCLFELWLKTERYTSVSLKFFIKKIFACKIVYLDRRFLSFCIITQIMNLRFLCYFLFSFYVKCAHLFMLLIDITTTSHALLNAIKSLVYIP